MFEWFKKLFNLGRNERIVPPINSGERLTIYKAITFTKKIRPAQHLTARLESANAKYDANNNQLHFKAKVISAANKLRRYDTQLVFNDISNRLERDGEHIIPYSNTGSKIEYFIKKPGKLSTIATRCSCFTADTLVPLADGYSVPISELVGKEKFYVYSYDLENNKSVIGLGHSARLTRKDANIVKITFDNGSTVKCTDDHLFLLNTGEYKQAKDLLPTDSLMALYRKETASRSKYTRGYEYVINPVTGEENLTYHMASEFNDIFEVENSCMRFNPETLESSFENELPSSEDIIVNHHLDHRKENNSPENIVKMFWKEHTSHHAHVKFEGDFCYFSTEDSINRMKTDNPMFNRETVEKMVETQRDLGYFEEAHRNFYDENGVHVATKLASEGKHHFQQESHKVNTSRIQKERAKKGIHYSQVAVKEGTHYFQTEDHKERTSKKQIELYESNSHPLQKMTREDYLKRDYNRKGQIPKVIDWFNNLPEGKTIFSYKDFNNIKKYIGYGTYEAFVNCVNKISDFNKVNNKIEKIIIGHNKSIFEVNKESDISFNHKIVSIEKCGKEDVYDLTVEKYHNFAIDLDNGKEYSSGVYVHNCKDYRHMFSWQNAGVRSHIGKLIKYKRVVPDSGRPPVNPTNTPGLCKHLLILIEWLEQRDMIDLDPDVKRYIDNIPRKG